MSLFRVSLSLALMSTVLILLAQTPICDLALTLGLKAMENYYEERAGDVTNFPKLSSLGGRTRAENAGLPIPSPSSPCTAGHRLLPAGPAAPRGSHGMAPLCLVRSGFLWKEAKQAYTGARGLSATSRKSPTIRSKELAIFSR